MGSHFSAHAHSRGRRPNPKTGPTPQARRQRTLARNCAVSPAPPSSRPQGGAHGAGAAAINLLPAACGRPCGRQADPRAGRPRRLRRNRRCASRCGLDTRRTPREHEPSGRVALFHGRGRGALGARRRSGRIGSGPGAARGRRRRGFLRLPRAQQHQRRKTQPARAGQRDGCARLQARRRKGPGAHRQKRRESLPHANARFGMRALHDSARAGFRRLPRGSHPPRSG